MLDGAHTQTDLQNQIRRRAREGALPELDGITVLYESTKNIHELRN